jgi:sigma-B regulation protein RsbU (phosphoserine phosphatase)
LRAVAGDGPDDRPPPEPAAEDDGFRWGPSWFTPIPGLDGYWLELEHGDDGDVERVIPVLTTMLGTERDSLSLVQQLHDRLEEIELLYTITETLGRTLGLAASARTIVREVATVVRARRASILVHDAELDVLRPVAGWGIDVVRFDPIPVDDECSIAARVFRTRETVEYDPRTGGEPPPCDQERTYRGAAFVSVPILYPQPGAAPRAIGVLSVTDRVGTDAFSDGDRRLLAAVASQVGASIENQRLIEGDREQQRVRRELELARELQVRLLKPRYQGAADVAARCVQAEGVGGDFYNFIRLPEHRLGVMLGDVSSHGYGAALIMALVLSASAIHAEEAGSPEDVLRLLLDSVGSDLEDTEMSLSLFYAVSDREQHTLRYANAGHPHAFVLRGDGTAERLGATAPPLGLGPDRHFTGAHTSWARGSDSLVLCTDGVVDARDGDNERFGEERMLACVRRARRAGARAAVDAVFAELEQFPGDPDDRSVLVLNA